MTSTTDESPVDWLLQTALEAIEAEKPQLSSWAKDKRQTVPRGRFEALKWLVRDLDLGNQQIVARRLGLTVEDLAAAGRVLAVI